MKNPNPRLLYLLPLLLTVALIVFGEALGDLWKEDVKAVFQQNKWLLLAFVGLLALVGFLWERRQRSEKPVPEEVDKDQYDEAFVQFRKNLLEQYQTRLNSKTGRRLPVNLTAKSTHFGMAPERVEAYFKDKELTIESENIASEIDKILKNIDRLLLVGDPGAGKTTILLYAAINILNKSYSSDDFESSDKVRALRSDDSKSSDRSDPKSPDRSKLPLILNLATWTKGRDFAEWYAQNIAHSYSLSPVFVRELLRRNAVVPFFDGFDEVAEEYRDDCFQKMAAYFGDEKRKQLIVSSRKKEYAAALADAPVYAEIEVQPLSLTQIKKALSENAQSQAADRALLYALEHDRWLAEAVETPFYLNTASFLFGKGQRTLADFPFEANNTEGRQAELVEIFVAEQVPEEQDRKYLHFLAEKMEQENFLVFELVKMQPWWCRNVWRYSIVFGLVGSLIGGLTGGLIFRLLFGLAYALTGALVGALVGSLMFSLVGGLGRYINISDVQIWNWQNFKKDWSGGIVFGLFTSLVFSLAGGLVFGLTSSLADNLDFGLIEGAFFGLVGGLVFGLAFGLKEAGTARIYLLHIPKPYHRFWSKFTLSFWLVPVLGLAFAIAGMAYLILVTGWTVFYVIDLVQTRFFWELVLPLAPLTLLTPLFLSNFLHHFSLRLILYLEGKMPLRVVTFMDRMSDQLIFEDNRRTNKKGKKMRGATWRFRHKILQDYFAHMGEVSSFEERKR